MDGMTFDIAHLLAGSLVLTSFMMIYQDRLYALLNTFALQAVLLGLAVAWQAWIQDARHLYVTAGIAFFFKGMFIPWILHGIVRRLGIHRQVETVVGIVPTMLAGIGLVSLSILLMLRLNEGAESAVVREDLAFALSVILLGMLMMTTRRNAVSQIVGFMSLENGLILAAAGAQGMSLVVEISVAFSVLVAMIVIGTFLFRIRERFDSVDLDRLDEYRGENP